MLRSSGPVFAGLALAFAVLAPAAANEPHVGLDLLWVRPAAEGDARPHCARLLVLNLPRDWTIGDAAVAIVGGDDAQQRLRALVEALLRELTAVLEVPSRAVEGCEVGAAEPVAEVLGAVRALRVDAGAGLVVAIGLGAHGPAVLAATREEVATPALGPGGPRLAAAIAIDGAGSPDFALGAPPEGQDWAKRAPLLCAALASVIDRLRLAACLAGLGGDHPVASRTDRARP
jgi:hypothetical protein